MDKMKRLINFVLPVRACNFRCGYCYIRQMNPPSTDLGTLQYPPEHIQRALTVERLGGVCHINICGQGETLIPAYAVDLAVRMLENGHFVSVVTNGTITNRIKALCCIPRELRERLFFKLSFHYLELERLGLMDRFFENVRQIRDSGCAFSIELTVNDESVAAIPDIRDRCCKEAGAFCHVIESRNNLDGFSRLTEMDVEDHQREWGVFESPLFAFQQEHWMEKRHEFCYAGDWVSALDVGSGWLTPCFAGGKEIQNIFEDIAEPIHFCAIGENCPWTHCYASHVLLTSGVIPEMEAPDYASLRDRCANGTSWLTPRVREFFSSRFAESNPLYDEGQRLWVTGLMGFIYGGESKVPDYELCRVLKGKMSEKRIRTVAVWGDGTNTQWLLPLLKSAGIRVRYLVDLEKESADSAMKRLLRYPAERFSRENDVVRLSRQDFMPGVDAMIVTDYSHISAIRKEIPSRFRRVLLITELADEIRK